MQCRNFDGAFGGTIGAESHAGQGSLVLIFWPFIHLSSNFLLCVVFPCVAALAILDKLDELDADTLGWWLAERQVPNGGLNGRPEKLEDVRLGSHHLTMYLADSLLVLVSRYATASGSCLLSQSSTKSHGSTPTN